MKKKILTTVLLVLFSLLLAVFFSQAGWIERPENLYYDLWHQLGGVRHKPNLVTIISIDNSTLLEHKDEPMVFWGPYFAQAIQVLRRVGVRIIGLDYLFTVSSESWLKHMGLPGDDKSRTYDIPLREQLASGQVVLAGDVLCDEPGKIEVIRPIWDYLFSLPRNYRDIGLTNLMSEFDGILRRFVPALVDGNGKLLGNTFAHLLAERAGGVDLSRQGHPPWYINFAGPPGTYPRISFRHLIHPQAENHPDIQGLKNKVVIIASETKYDSFLTPYAQGFLGLTPAMMSGAEIHANIVETLLTAKFIKPVPMLPRYGYLIVMTITGITLFLRLSPLQGLVALVLLNVGSAGLAFLLFGGRLVLPVASVQLALLSGYLATLGVRLTGEERAKTRLRRIFGRYVSEEIVEKLLASGKYPDLGGEAFQVTILFSDIRGFTSISETLSPHEVVELLNTYFSRVCEHILGNGGTVDKFIGDAVMAVFGAPAHYSDHALRALKTAIKIVEEANKFQSWISARFSGKLAIDFNIGIGIHTGEAVLGNIGSLNRMEFTCIGDTVNTASRLESLTKELGWQIIASRETIQAAGPGVTTGRTQEIMVKGRQKPVKVFEVNGLNC